MYLTQTIGKISSFPKEVCLLENRRRTWKSNYASYWGKKTPPPPWDHSSPISSQNKENGCLFKIPIVLREAKRPRSPELTRQPASLLGKLHTSERPHLKNNDSPQGMTSEVVLCPLHKHTHIHVCTNIHEHTHTQNKQNFPDSNSI